MVGVAVSHKVPIGIIIILSSPVSVVTFTVKVIAVRIFVNPSPSAFVCLPVVINRDKVDNLLSNCVGAYSTPFLLLELCVSFFFAPLYDIKGHPKLFLVCLPCLFLLLPIGLHTDDVEDKGVGQTREDRPTPLGVASRLNRQTLPTERFVVLGVVLLRPVRHTPTLTDTDKAVFLRVNLADCGEAGLVEVEVHHTHTDWVRVR